MKLRSYASADEQLSPAPRSSCCSSSPDSSPSPPSSCWRRGTAVRCPRAPHLQTQQSAVNPVFIHGRGSFLLTVFRVGGVPVAPVGFPPGRLVLGLLSGPEVTREAAVLLQGLQAGDVDVLVRHWTQRGDAPAQVHWEGQKVRKNLQVLKVEETSSCGSTQV